MSSALNDEIEKDVLPWLRLAEDLRVLKLDVEVSCFKIKLLIEIITINELFYSLTSLKFV